MADLYKGIAGSPITYLAADISANQTTISIADDSALPPAPNICTIGYGEHLETIKYENKSNGVLQNVTRGIEGTPQAWPAGTEVARFFTAYDHNSIIENFNSHLAESATNDTTAHGIDKLLKKNGDRANINTIFATSSYPGFGANASTKLFYAQSGSGQATMPLAHIFEGGSSDDSASISISLFGEQQYNPKKGIEQVLVNFYVNSQGIMTQTVTIGVLPTGITFALSSLDELVSNARTLMITIPGNYIALFIRVEALSRTGKVTFA